MPNEMTTNETTATTDGINPPVSNPVDNPHEITQCLREFKDVLGDLHVGLVEVDFDLMRTSLERKGEILDRMSAIEILASGDIDAILKEVGDDESEEVKALLLDCKEMTDVSIELARIQNSRADRLIATVNDEAEPAHKLYNNKGRVS